MINFVNTQMKIPNEAAEHAYKGEILIVDDEPKNLELLSEMLTAEHYDVRVAKSSELALASVKFSLPDLILLDINMPLMDGYEVCRKLKAVPETQNVPVIFVSVNDAAIDKVHAFSCGAADYITKPFHIEEVTIRIESQLKIARLSRELQLQVLRYQLNPHFLFNSLITVRNLVAVYGGPAETIINQLSEYLRYLLMNRDHQQISVQEELEAAQNYLEIEKIRFEERINIKFDIDIRIGSLIMPAFLLQPLLENAIKYGMRTSPMPLQVELCARRKGEMLYFSVTNSGHWLNAKENDLPQAISLGIGLQNVRTRLKQLYPYRHNFKIEKDERYVSIIIEIPIK